MQFGAFQPILRVHSNHGLRLPWEYGKRAEQIASGFMRLRGTMIPFLYTLGRQAYDTGLPLARPMYLGWPKADAAYRFDGQYMLGDSLLVAPIAKPGKRVAKRVWFPPGEWVDMFTGAVRRGGGARLVTAPLDRIPVFARAGSIVPRQPYTSQVGRGQAEKLTLDVYGGADGKFTLYEDKGEGFGYVQKQFARTQLRWTEGPNQAQLSIGRARGKFKGLPATRGYELRIGNVRRPKRIVLAAGGRTRQLRGWRFDRPTRRLEVPVGRIGTRRGATVRLEF
jgi:alpha-glucosidase (family GH31 glycosyl hydrolase)